MKAGKKKIYLEKKLIIALLNISGFSLWAFILTFFKNLSQYLWFIHLQEARIRAELCAEQCTAPLKLRKTNRRALTKFHCRCYLWVCGVQKIWKLKISDEGFLIFPIFWKKNWKKSGKKFSKFFFFTKICFSELEKAYVQLFVLNFFFV